jgi:alkylation response protein AidB-like acyl-CoA dehydrogenase
MQHEPLALVEDLERHLGDPRDPTAPFSFARCAELDAVDGFPDAICGELDGWGVQNYYVPVEHGGALNDYEAALHLMRAIARRDLTVAIAHGKTFLGAVSAWVAGPGPTTERVAELVRKRAPVSWGLTERDHGSDLMAGDVAASAVPGGFRLNGEKWLINNATLGRAVSVLARSDPAGGPRGFDVFVVDKDDLPETAFECLPKVYTHGIRGADISGISFRDAFVPTSARLGEPGTGLDIVLKGLQLTRTMCSSLSLGGAEHALRLGVQAAAERPDDEELRRVLAEGYSDLLLLESLSIVAARSVHALTGELSVTSAVVKYLLPTRTDALIRALQRQLGVRSVGVSGFNEFQKVARDHRIVGIFDGNTLVNLTSIVGSIPLLARRRRDGPAPDALRETFDLSVTPRNFDPSGLALVARKGSSLLASLPAAVEELTQTSHADPELSTVAELAGALLRQAESIAAEMREHRAVAVTIPAASFDLAKRIVLCVAAAAAINFWLRNHELCADTATAPLWRHGHWLSAVLGRILNSLQEPVALSADTREALLDVLLRQCREGWALSLLPFLRNEGMR